MHTEVLDVDAPACGGVLPGIVSPSVTLPVPGGKPLLGTWQSVMLVDLDRDNPRRSVRLSFIDG